MTYVIGQSWSLWKYAHTTSLDISARGGNGLNPSYWTHGRRNSGVQVLLKIFSPRGQVSLSFHQGMLANAQNTLISGGNFTAITHVSTPDDGREGLALLRSKIAAGAFHNSAERYDPPKCHPQTREIVLNKIMDWVKDSQKTFLFLWLYGPAGAGKSAIAQTIAEMCYSQGALAASFFFSRNSANRNNETLLITTILYQLTISIPEIRERVGRILEYDPLLLSRSLEAQLQALIVNPLNEAAQDQQMFNHLLSCPRLIIIDGLDECAEPKTQRYILDTLVSSIRKLTIPLFVLVASRPDPPIRDAFNQDVLNDLTTRIVLDDSYQPDADIRRFILARFDDVKRKHSSLVWKHPPWPSTMDVEILVQKSSGQFIYASTVMKYLDSHNHWPPDRLDIAFGLYTTDDDTPLAELDLFYHHILSSVAQIQKVLDVFTFLLFVQFWEKTCNVIEDFFFFRRGEINTVMSDLHSLVSIPPPGDDLGELRMFHASFPDFLLDRSRSGKFFINATQASTKIAQYCMKHFKRPSVMCEDGLNLHHLRALFMLHSATAQTSYEFLDDLLDVDIRAQLSFWASDDNVIGMYEHDNKRIITFLIWMSEQSHRGKNLLLHHLDSVDHWFLCQLENYPHKYLLRQLLAAGMFTGFVSKDVFAILGPVSVANSNDNPKSQKPRRFDPLQIYSPREEYTKFYSILSNFLKNSTRSQTYHVNEMHYATLSTFVAIFLLRDTGFDLFEAEDSLYRNHKHKKIDRQYQKIACDLLTFSLLRSAKDTGLARILQKYNPRLIFKEDLSNEIVESVEAAFEYLRTFRNRGPDNMRLLVATKKCRSEEAVPDDAYVVWAPQHSPYPYELGIHYDEIF